MTDDVDGDMSYAVRAVGEERVAKLNIRSERVVHDQDRRGGVRVRPSSAFRSACWRTRLRCGEFRATGSRHAPRSGPSRKGGHCLSAVANLHENDAILVQLDREATDRALSGNLASRCKSDPRAPAEGVVNGGSTRQAGLRT